MTSSHGYFEGAGGIRLHYRAWEADEPRAALLVVHGQFEHSRRYHQLGLTMARSGFSTYAMDLRGHGESGGPRGHAARFRLLLDDLVAFHREVRRMAGPAPPAFLVGHSMGGLVGLRYLQELRPPLAGAIIIAPWLGTAARTPRWKQLLGRLLSPLLPALQVPVRIDPSDLSHDVERVADYRTDPRIHSILTPRMFTEVTRAMDDAFRHADRLRIPLLFLLAGDDRIVDTDRSLALTRALDGDTTTVQVLDGYFHEVLQERERAEVLVRMVAWIEEQLRHPVRDPGSGA